MQGARSLRGGWWLWLSLVSVCAVPCVARAGAGGVSLASGEVITLDGVVSDIASGGGLQPAGGFSAVLVRRDADAFWLLKGEAGAGVSEPVLDGVHPAGAGPDRVALGDLDGDGDSDLVFTNPNANRVRVVWNRGGDADAAERYELGPILVVGEGVSGAAVADIDGDGRRDIVSANRSGHSFTVMRNLGGGVFQSSGSIGTTAFGPTGVAVADFDRDGLADVALSGRLVDRVSVHRGVGGGAVSFGAAETVAVGRGPSRVFAVDVDLDGWVDLVTVNELSSNLSVVMNDGGVFAGAAAVPLGSGVTDAAAGDLNGDGLVDFAASVSSGLALAVNGGGGSFSAASVGSALAIGRVGIVDVAGGRQADVVAAALQSGTVLVFENVTPPAGTVVCPGDVSSDRRVGLDDLLVVLSAFGCGGGCGGADATGDGAVSLDDLMLVLSRFGAACGTE